MSSAAPPVSVTLSLQRVKRKYRAECRLGGTVFTAHSTIARGSNQGKHRALTARKQLAEQLSLFLKPHLPAEDIETISNMIQSFPNGKHNSCVKTLALKTSLLKATPLKNQPAPAKPAPAKQIGSSPTVPSPPVPSPPVHGPADLSPIDLSPVRLHSDYSHNPAWPHDLFFAVTATGLPQELHFWGRVQSQEHGETVAIHRARGLCRLLGLPLPIYCDEQQIAKKLGVRHIPRSHAAHKTVHKLCSTARKTGHLLSWNKSKLKKYDQALKTQAPEQLYIAQLTLGLPAWSAIRYGPRTTLFGPDSVRIAAWTERA